VTNIFCKKDNAIKKEEENQNKKIFQVFLFKKFHRIGLRDSVIKSAKIKKIFTSIISRKL